MIVCVCKGVTDRDLHSVVESGCRTVKDVGAACDAGTDCGACTRSIHRLLAERRSTRDLVETSED